MRLMTPTRSFPGCSIRSPNCRTFSFSLAPGRIGPGPAEGSARSARSRSRSTSMTSRYVGADDVARYVEQRLLATEEPGRPTPYRSSPNTARAVARAVAERADKVFLVAHTAVQALLAAASMVDVSQPGWVERLPTGLDEAFTSFLVELDTRRPGGLSSGKARVVLLPLAFAEGEGLPWVDLWAALATALSDSSISNADVALVRNHAAAFIVEAIEHDRSVYRLYHERLAEHLRSTVDDSTDAQRRLVGALRSRVPDFPDATGPDWMRAHPYVLMHLAAHAVKAGTLGKLAADGGFLAAADPQRALQALSVSTDPKARRVYACYSLAFDRMRDQPPETRLSYLQMIARQQADDELAKGWGDERLRRRWSVPWARWLPVTTHRMILAHTPVSSVALATLEGRPVIVAVGDDTTLYAWDLASGAPLSQPQFRNFTEEYVPRLLREHAIVGTIDGRPVVVSQGSLGELAIWDLASGQQRGGLLRVSEDDLHHLYRFRLMELKDDARLIAGAVALGAVEGRTTIVQGGVDGTIYLWDLDSGQQRAAPLRGHAGPVIDIALGTLDGRPIVVSGGYDRTVRVWDLASGKQLGKPLRGHKHRVVTVALGALDGRSVIVSGGDDGTVRVWDLASGKQRGKPLRVMQVSVNAVVLGRLDRQPVIVAGGGDEATVQVWDLASGATLGEPMRGHEGAVTDVALGTLDGRPIVVSGGTDQTVRVWDLASGNQEGHSLSSQNRAVNSVAPGTLHDRQVIASGGDDGMVRVWDLTSGEQAEPLRGHKGLVSSVALGMLDGRPIAVSGGQDGTVRVWDITAGTQLDRPLRDHEGLVSSVALGTFNGRPIAVSGGHDGTVRVWDIGSRSPRARLRGHKRRVTSVAFGTLDGRPIVVSGGDDGMVRVWDLRRSSGMQRGEPLYHKGQVFSVALGTLHGQPVIVSGGLAGTVFIWDLASGAPLSAALRGGEMGGLSVAMGTLDGRPVIFSGGYDGIVRVWDAAGAAVSSVYIGSRIRSLANAGPGMVAVAGDRGLLLLQFEMKQPSSLPNTGS